MQCHCGSGTLFQNCCQPYIQQIKKAPTALALMRSRYSAYATHEVFYLLETTHNSKRKYYSKVDIYNWATANQWTKLEIVNFNEDTVEFKAHFTNEKFQEQIHHELSTFTLENGSWYYVDGQFLD
ncbi:hypothetical protein DB895_11480 [Flavobacterium psychrotolerans]|uniref:YchJ-like middle NTF2-like domain-containing protein n=1 Tax=Flavobacterium psychrotolerans TaxID=2169410 RepID=A0A2U1JGZ4_9FLAO|nr:hypothetical protein DB895_11480 [Flavobacterium psychrotolerans]